MRSHSESSYGARIGNAESLVAALQNFSNYQAIKPEYSIVSFSGLINTTKGFNNTVAGKKQSFSLAVENRIQIFYKGNLAIKKILSPINGAVKASFGRTSKEATDVAAIIAKLRGANIVGSKTDINKGETVSQSYQSYNSRVQYFADLVVNLTNFGPNYEPANTALKATNLNSVYTDAVGSNNEVMNTYTRFAQENTIRLDSYALLTKIAIGIKDAVKAQYGFNSTEYRLIKGLKI